MRTRYYRGCAVLVGLAAALLAGRGIAAEPQDRPQQRAEAGKPVRVLVAYYTLTGNTEKMAAGVAEGSRRVPGAAVEVKRVEKVSKEDLVAADAIILGCPTYFANIPGKMKLVIDDWNWKWKVEFTDKVGGAFATAGGQVGGQGHVVNSLLLFMIHNRMIVAGPLYEDAEGDDKWAESGAAAITGPINPGVGPAELDAAGRLGERIARLASRIRSTRNEE